jgi:TolB-like protein
MGEVYRARDAQLGREVAVKIISGGAPADEATVERFIRETRAAAALSHTAIIAVHDVGTHEGSPFLVTELLEGETLRARIARGPLGVRSGLEIAIQIAHGLAVAHARGILHRDLKPENLFVTADGTAKILDFGLAKLLPSSGATGAALDVTAQQQLTQAGAVLGTAAYMAPEQLDGRAVDHRADQFAFGVVLYEMFGGQRPFQHATVHETLAAILRDEPRSLASLRPELPDRLSRIVTRCLAKEPSARYESTRDLAMALQEVRDELTAGSEPQVTGARGVKRRLSPISMGLLVGVLLVVVGGAAAWRWLAPTETPSVAVLPFSTIGGGDQYFADGITAAVTTELGRVGGLRVIASNSTFAYRDKTAFREIGRELGVGLVVKGSVQRADGRVRIDVTLVDTHDDTALWSERYSRELTDVLTVQVDASNQAQRLDPSALAPANRRVGALTDAGRLEELRHELDRHGTRLSPMFHADALLAIGQPEEALRALSPLEITGGWGPGIRRWRHSDDGSGVRPTRPPGGR